MRIGSSFLTVSLLHVAISSAGRQRPQEPPTRKAWNLLVARPFPGLTQRSGTLTCMWWVHACVQFYPKIEIIVHASGTDVRVCSQGGGESYHGMWRCDQVAFVRTCGVCCRRIHADVHGQEDSNVCALGSYTAPACIPAQLYAYALSRASWARSC